METGKTKRLKVTLIKSPIGFPRDQRDTVRALGLRKLNGVNILDDNQAIRGMIAKVRHLVTVDELAE
ncbi:MAG TPA: 50S ribosomal protein L30 [Firmicutes bacterium]|nr:50S ribosomal protein L30 [Bacillota bacterium]HHY98460.1 50S ribosomal protein L30 [Bacillota bacterium]